MAKSKGIEYKRKLIQALHKANIGTTLNLWCTKTRVLEKMIRDNINVVSRANQRAPASVLAQTRTSAPPRAVHKPKSVARRKLASHPIDSLQFVKTDAFLQSREWQTLRYEAIRLQGGRCQCCGATAADGAIIQVDHIKPRSKFPELALTLENLQVLCRPCNMGKGAWDQTDWRSERKPEPTGMLFRQGKVVGWRSE